MHGPLGQNTDDTADTSCSRCGFGGGASGTNRETLESGQTTILLDVLELQRTPLWGTELHLLHPAPKLHELHSEAPSKASLPSHSWRCLDCLDNLSRVCMYLDGCFGSCLGLVLSSSTAVAPRDDLVAWRFGWHCEVTLLECNTQNESESVSSVSSDSSGSRGSYELVTEETNSPSGFSYPAQVHKSPLRLSDL